MQDIITIYKQIGRTLRHLTAIAERGREGIVVFDLNRVIQFVNAAWTVMHGYERPDELVGKQISTFHTQEQMASDVIPFIERAEQRGQFTGRLGHIRRDGTPFFTETLMVVFNDDEGRAVGLVGFAADLTEQERKEDELRQYRCRMEELIKQQTEELEAANSRLQSQATEQEQAGQKLKQEIAEMSAANEQLREQIGEQERVKEEFQQQRDKFEQSMRRQSDELTTTRSQLQDEISKRKKAEEYFKQQADAIKAAGERLRTQIDELSAHGPVGEPDMLKAEDSVETAGFITDDEQALLENVFRQNIVLQKPKLDSAAIEDS
jgi:PAS domain S-box-containing protein